MKINTIIRNKEYLVEKISQFDSKNYKEPYDVAKYISEKYDKNGFGYDSEYESECIKKYISCYSHKKNELTFDINFYDLSFSDYFKVTGEKVVTITLIPGQGGAGDGSDFFFIIEFIITIANVLKSFIELIRKIFICIKPFDYITNEFGYDKEFVIDVIKMQKTWKYGFIKFKNLPFKRLSERILMKKCGYKLKNKVWLDNNNHDFDDLHYKYR